MLWHGKKVRNFLFCFSLGKKWVGVVGACGSSSDLELKENALINPGGLLGCRSEGLQL